MVIRDDERCKVCGFDRSLVSVGSLARVSSSGIGVTIEQKRAAHVLGGTESCVSTGY